MLDFKIVYICDNSKNIKIICEGKAPMSSSSNGTKKTGSTGRATKKEVHLEFLLNSFDDFLYLYITNCALPSCKFFCIYSLIRPHCFNDVAGLK